MINLFYYVLIKPFVSLVITDELTQYAPNPVLFLTASIGLQQGIPVKLSVFLNLLLQVKNNPLHPWINNKTTLFITLRYRIFYCYMVILVYLYSSITISHLHVSVCKIPTRVFPQIGRIVC